VTGVAVAAIDVGSFTTEPARVLAFFLTDPNDPMLRMDSAQDEAAG
jgi:hypothetical protein